MKSADVISANTNSGPDEPGWRIEVRYERDGGARLREDGRESSSRLVAKSARWTGPSADVEMRRKDPVVVMEAVSTHAAFCRSCFLEW